MSESITITGKAHDILPIDNFQSGFQKQSLIVETESQYPQFINVEFINDKIELLNNISVGNEVKVSININGKKWESPQGETKYFNSITAWRIEKLGK